MNEIRYRNLSYSELASLCVTDDGARQYVADNARDFLTLLDDGIYEHLQEQYEVGIAFGRAELAREIIGEVGKALEEFIEDAPPDSVVRRMHDMLVAETK